MTYKIKVVYSIEGTVHNDYFESETRPSIAIRAKSGIVKLDGEDRTYIYSNVWKIERINE